MGQIGVQYHLRVGPLLVENTRVTHFLFILNLDPDEADDKEDDGMDMVTGMEGTTTGGGGSSGSTATGFNVVPAPSMRGGARK